MKLNVWLVSLVSVAAAVVLSAPAPAQAQRAVTLERLDVQLWPEYDKPDVLVMMVGHIAAETAMPTTVGLVIPKGVGKPHAVAKHDPSRQGMLMANYTMDETDPGWTTVNVQTEFREFRVEYYAPLDRTTDVRKFVWAMPMIHDAKQVTFQVQEPKGATNMKTVPAATESTKQEDGLTYHNGSFGVAKPGDRLKLEFSYTKSTADTSVPAQVPKAPPVAPMAGGNPPAPAAPVPPIAPIQPPVTPGSGSSSWLMYLLVGVLSAAAMWAFMTLRKPQSKR